jgi:hypothetical protein
MRAMIIRPCRTFHKKHVDITLLREPQAYAARAPGRDDQHARVDGGNAARDESKAMTNFANLIALLADDFEAIAELELLLQLRGEG